MNNILNIKSPAEDQAQALKSEYALKNHGLTNLRKVYWNLPTEALYEEIVFRSEGRISHQGPIIVHTGSHTSRSAQDKFFAREAATEDIIWWGEYNRPISSEKFEEIYSRMQGFVQGRDLFVQDCYVGASPDYCLAIRIITEYAWHSLFAHNMFLLPKSSQEYKTFVPDFTVFAVPSFQPMPQIDGTRTETLIALSFANNLGIIAGTAYGGEIKKTVFTIMNYLLPLKGVLSMHCSANAGNNKETALFFGLSGTGKTTLSADPNRDLIGDDEHGWSDEGIFNFEGGCYAKVIQLSEAAEPEIYACTHKFGTILENVVVDPITRLIDLNDDKFTENTRASYPLEYIANAIPEKIGGHPKNIVFLTCDAQGVMPPIARLTPEQAMYHFISGYTSKIGGTESGVGKDPEITFSACFGGPFMVHSPLFYADLLKKKILRYGVNVWLLNTGWVGGSYGIGKRISIRYSRDLLNAALTDTLLDVEYHKDPIFGYLVPKSCPGVPENILNPAGSWPNQTQYQNKYKQLAARFIENFRKFEPESPPDVVQAGPKI
jgi:phosphoenolpyruvate carboxykinase (ATP)